MANIDAVQSVSGISLVTKGNRHEPPELDANTINESDITTVKGEKEDCIDNNQSKEEMEHDQLAELYKAMPARIYLEKTQVVSAITLALQSAVEARPKDAVEYVANYLLNYKKLHHQDKEKQ
eukprot:18182_1